jgi:hypothetical protein
MLVASRQQFNGAAPALSKEAQQERAVSAIPANHTAPIQDSRQTQSTKIHPGDIQYRSHGCIAPGDIYDGWASVFRYRAEECKGLLA